jgi:hypothetical protein
MPVLLGIWSCPYVHSMPGQLPCMTACQFCCARRMYRIYVCATLAGAQAHSRMLRRVACQTPWRTHRCPLCSEQLLVRLYELQVGGGGGVVVALGLTQEGICQGAHLGQARECRITDEG